MRIKGANTSLKILFVIALLALMVPPLLLFCVAEQEEDDIGYAVAGDAWQEGELRASLELQSNFNFTFYANPKVICSLRLGENELAAESKNGKNLYTVCGITPDIAAEPLCLTVGVSNNGNISYSVLEYSFFDYAHTVLSASKSKLEGQMVLAAAEYIRASYLYLGKEAPELSAGTISLNKQIISADKVTSLTPAIASAQLYLAEVPTLRFSFDRDFTGEVKINDYNLFVSAGKVGEATYFDIQLSLVNIAKKVIIEAGGESAEYSIKNYASSDIVKQSEGVKSYVDALYTYGYYARRYENGKDTENIIPGGDTPPVDLLG